MLRGEITPVVEADVKEIEIVLAMLFVWLIFGMVYAGIIALRPFRPGLTWLSVVVGDGLTDIGSGMLLYALTGSLMIAVVPLLFHAMTGGPMIAGQVLKHRFLRKQASSYTVFKRIKIGGGHGDSA